MAVNRETLRLLDGMRIALNAHVDDATRSLVTAWARTWDELTFAWHQAVADSITAVEDGRWPTAGEIDRLGRVTRALAATRAGVDRLTSFTGVTVMQLVPTVVTDAETWEREMIASQFPPAGLTGSLSLTFNRVDARALDAIVNRTAREIASYTAPLSAEAEESMRAALVRGVAIGENPSVAAANMLDRVEGEFNGGLARALNIARTEMIDAHRLSAQQADMANPHVVTGWYWSAVLDERTCPSCWSQNGSLHPADEFGPDDHQSGRCARVPVTVSWADLGFTGIDEPASLITDAETTFNGLPDATQLRIMGPARLDALKSGRASWSDLSVKRESPGWRDSWAVRPVKDLVPAG